MPSVGDILPQIVAITIEHSIWLAPRVGGRWRMSWIKYEDGRKVEYMEVVSESEAPDSSEGWFYVDTTKYGVLYKRYL